MSSHGTYSRYTNGKCRCTDCRAANSLYSRQRRGTRIVTLEERFWSKVDAAGICWEWTARKTDDGYGAFRFRGNSKGAHRVAYTLLVGEIPPSLQIDHLCRNRGCVNPDHLEVVTQQVNIARRPVNKNGHTGKTRCANGHPYDAENNPYINPTTGWRRCRICQRRYQRTRLESAS